MRPLLRARWLAALALPLFACTLHIRPAPLEPHLAPLTVVESNPGLRLGVAAFRDLRPPAVRREIHPPLRLSALGMGRRGDVRTGDVSFGGEVVSGIRDDTIATLVRSGTFSEVIPLPDDVGPEIPPELDLVLSAEIEQFGAIQFHDASVHLLRPGWLRTRTEDAVGYARIRYSVRPRRGSARSYLVDIEHSTPELSITQAARDALALASESIAGSLYTDWAKRPRPGLRSIRVRVLDGCRLGPERLRSLLAEAAEVFEREADLRFEVTTSEWKTAPPRATLEEALAALKTETNDPDGIVLGLLSRRHLHAPMLAREPFGLAAPLGEHAVVRCELDGRLPVVTLIHELGHLFGAVHVHDRSSVMHPVAAFDGRFFDPLNRRILRTARERAFGVPLADPIARDLRAIYETTLRSPGCCDTRGLEDALRTLDAAATPAGS